MPDTEDAWTIGRLLTWTTDFLRDRGADSPRLDAEVLLAEALGCQRIELYTAFEQIATEETRSAFRELVRRRAEGMPVAYLVGRREFYSLAFHVTPDVLIPRPETELLVVRLLDLAKQRKSDSPPRIADVGTGSGIIAICAAKQLPDCRVTAIDLSREALDVARRNASEHDVEDRIEFVQGDLLEPVAAESRFDFVASNPPYVTTSEWTGLARDVKDFEPRMALDAGVNGTEVIKRLIPQAATRLKPGGHLLIEIGPSISEAVESLLDQTERLERGPTIKDLARLPRIVQAELTSDAS